MTTAAATRTIRQSIWIAKPPSAVFRALTEPDQLTAWLVPRIEPVVDSPRKYRCEWPHHSFDVEFLEVVSDRSVTLSWFSGNGVGPTVAFTVEPAGDGSLVRLTHAGFNAAEEFLDSYFGHIEGWAMYLCNLKCFLDFGRDLRADQPGGTIAM